MLPIFWRSYQWQPGRVEFGDLNEDGFVDTIDFLALLASWGPCPGPCPPPFSGDLNADCAVDTVDFLMLIANWS